MGRQNFLTRFPPDRLDPHRGDPGFSNITESDSGDPDIVRLEIMKNPSAWARAFDDPVFGEAVEPPELPPSFYETLGQWQALAEDSWLRYSSPSEVADVSYRLDRRSLGCLRALCTEADFDRLISTVTSYVHVADFYRAAAERGQAIIGHSA